MKAREEIDSILRDGLIRLLGIKDSDIRILTLEQGYAAVDHGIHIGGAFSAVVPMVSLYYGGVMRIDVEQPTRVGQDLFILSKGHAVASMASIYANLGYFSRGVLLNYVLTELLRKCCGECCHSYLWAKERRCHVKREKNILRLVSSNANR